MGHTNISIWKHNPTDDAATYFSITKPKPTEVANMVGEISNKMSAIYTMISIHYEQRDVRHMKL